MANYITIAQSFALLFVAYVWSSKVGLNLLIKVVLLALAVAPFALRFLGAK